MNKFDINAMLAMNFDGGAFMDSLMWFCSQIWAWIPLYAIVLFLIYRRFGWRYMLFALLFFGIGIGICDQICNFFKDNIAYLRPTRVPELSPMLHTVNGYKGGTYGTVSGHASTSFSIFVLSSLIMRRKWFTAMMLTYAVLTAYSRIYLGVHFPMQIVFGITLGTLVGILMWKVFSWLNAKYRWDKALRYPVAARRAAL